MSIACSFLNTSDCQQTRQAPVPQPGPAGAAAGAVAGAPVRPHQAYLGVAPRLALSAGPRALPY